jgi:CheY-like chemotaxis protein
MPGTPDKILIIDDDSDDVLFLKEAISSTGRDFVFEEAWNGEDALNLLYQFSEPPDYIFLDLNMPRQNGREFLTRFRNQNTSVPVFIYTTSSIDADKAQAMSLGANEVIVKPVRLDELAQVVALLFESYPVKK